jgi:hypothetical protein
MLHGRPLATANPFAAHGTKATSCRPPNGLIRYPQGGTSTVVSGLPTTTGIVDLLKVK